jgi:murein DD-endopeptidase MepM/ murein hydrolase activator NlpD
MSLRDKEEVAPDRVEEEAFEQPSRVRAMWSELGGRDFPVARLLRHLSLFLVIGVGAWAARLGLSHLPADVDVLDPSVLFQPRAAPTETPQVGLDEMPFSAAGGLVDSAVDREANPHTVIPTRPRFEVITYTVKQGDTVFGIAEKFGLKPQTILWGNYDVLKDNPHRLRPEQELRILPVDGTLHVWNEGEGLSGVADFYGISPLEIIDWPGNDLPPDTDLQDPEIEPGTELVVPGGSREFVSWSAPRIPRSNPSVASILGPGACGLVYDGPIGAGAFVWPATNHWLSGYDYSPATNHYGIDIGGSEGNAIFAVDAGVVVYSGWHNGGYGNVIVLDHGNGWQTLYAHLSQTHVGCGEGVFQGAVIGLMGSTGNSTGTHLHFEMLHEQFGRVNPWNFLP